MTAADVETKTGVGRVVRVIGPVVDAEFPRDAMPEIFNALHVDVTLSGGTKTLTLEVALHLGDNMVRTISMQPSRLHRDRPDHVVTEVQGDLQGQRLRAAGQRHVDVQRVEDLRHRVAGELGVDHRADHPDDAADTGLGLYISSSHHSSLPAAVSAFAPATISLISWVISA